MFKQLWFAKLLMVLMAATAHAYDPAAGAAGAVLKWGLSARSLAMGGAMTALADDSTAAFWNPAGLALAGRQDIGGTYTVIPDAGDYTQISYVLPFSAFCYTDSCALARDTGGIGFYIMRLAASYAIESRHADTLNPDYLFSDVEGAYGLAFGHSFSGWCAGVGVKGLNHQLDTINALGWGVDAGVLWTGWPGWRLGFMLRDAYTREFWPGRQETVPLALKAGAACTLAPAAGHHITLSADLEQLLSRRIIRPRAGLEYGFQGVVFVRAGYDDGQAAVGGGVRVPDIGWGQAGLVLDYALLQDRIAGWDHWITLGLLF